MVLAAASSGAALAHHEAGGQHPAQTQAPAVGAKTGKGTGVIQHIDREKRTVTIKHGPLRGMNLPGMTVSYLVKDKAMLLNLQPMQRVEFQVIHDGRDYLITDIR